MRSFVTSSQTHFDRSNGEGFPQRCKEKKQIETFDPVRKKRRNEKEHRGELIPTFTNRLQLFPVPIDRGNEKGKKNRARSQIA